MGVVNAARNQEERNFFESLPRWTPELILSCSADEKVCISIGICCLSAVLCVIACLLLLCKRYRRKSWYVGDSAGSVLYCFLGNLCGTVGAFLSYQLVIQVFMGVLLTTLDVLHLIFIIIPVFGKTERRLKIMRKRRRQNVLVLSLPLVLGVGIFTYHGVYLVQGNKGPVGRHLLSLDLQDNLEILGYTLGLLSFVIGWTSKLPFLAKAYQGKTLAERMSFGMLSALANPSMSSSWDCPALENPNTPWLGKDITKDSTQQKKCLKNTAEIGQYLDVNIHPVQPVPKVFLQEVKISKEGQTGTLPQRRTLKEVREVDPCSSDSSSTSSSINPDLELQWVDDPE
ncbi:hypothetical protein GJAV_G00072310 [Gymnothorax javanicus]|nr:hypothetical protein GJAV_G00072310 [Gymnothorax javanicus]